MCNLFLILLGSIFVVGVMNERFQSQHAILPQDMNRSLSGGTVVMPVQPFLKWPGGKRWIAPLVVHGIAPYLKRTYLEPFFGGGAVFFRLQPKRAILSDMNPELIHCVRSVRDNVDCIVDRIRMWSNSKSCYYRVRKRRPHGGYVAAARLIYLTRTCWGGMYRVNQRGEFNVPFGNSGRPVCDFENLKACAHVLRHTDIYCSDFKQIIELANAGDVVYADPPYTTLGQGNGFLRYNERLFKWSDQQRLSVACHDAARRDAFVAVSGMWHDELLKLYSGWWAWKVGRKSLVSRALEARRTVLEVVLFSKKPKLNIEGLWRID